MGEVVPFRYHYINISNRSNKTKWINLRGSAWSAWASWSASTTAWVDNTTTFGEGSSTSQVLLRRQINAEPNPSKDTISHRISNKRVFQDRIARRRFLSHNSILSIENETLGIGIVDGLFLDGVDEVLVEEELAYVGDVASVVGSVLEDGAVKVHGDVDVRGTTRVVAGEVGDELGDAGGVSDAVAAEEGVVQVARISETSTISTRHDAPIDSGSVGVPDVEVSSHDAV